MPSLISFNVDLTVHEGTRLAAVLDGIGPDWDPTEIVTGEADARRMLYADLDPSQQPTYDLLIAAGELPDTPER